MSVVEDVRQVLQDFLTPEIREIRGRLDSIDKRLDSRDKRIDTVESGNALRYQALAQRIDVVENANGIRYQAIIQRLEQIQPSFAFDRRISALESEKTRSAWSSLFIVETSLKKLDTIHLDLIDQSMFLADTSAPASS